MECFVLQPRLMNASKSVLLAALALGGSGCGAAASEAAKSAAPSAAEGALEEAREPDNRQDIATLLGDPKIHAASRELAEAMASGALAGLTEQEQLDRMKRFSEELATEVSRSLTKSMSSELGPQISKIAADSVQQTLERLQSPEAEQRAAEFAQGVTLAIVEGLTEELGASGTQPMAYTPEQQGMSAMGMLAREAGRGAALGFQDAVRETELRRQRGNDRSGDVLALPGRLADLGLGTLSLLGLALGGLGLGLIAALVWSILRARRLARASQAREDAVVLLASVIKSAENAPWAPDLRDRIREASRDSAAANTLRDVLRRHAGLRLERADAPRHERDFTGPLHPAR